MAKAAVKKSALDIFSVIKRLDSRDMDYIYRLKPDERKELDKSLSYPMLRWMSCAEDRDMHEYYLIAINDLVNELYFGLADHKVLQYKLMAAVGYGRWAKHKWIKPVQSKREGPVMQVLTEAFPHNKIEDNRLWLELNGKEGFEELLSIMGYQTEERKDIMKTAFPKAG